jgi:hypothetical protein
MFRVLLCTLLILGTRAAALAQLGPGAPPLNPAGKKPLLRPGEKNTPAAKGERVKTDLKVGDPAPDFSLTCLETNAPVRLSSFQGKKPVVLIFGSYT